MRIVSAVLIVSMSLLLADSSHAEERVYTVRNLLAPILGMSESDKVIEITESELRSLFCLAGGAVGGAATLLVTGTAIAVVGPPGSQTTIVALPLISATMWAACGFAAGAAPAVAWFLGNSEELLRRLWYRIDGIPGMPEPSPGAAEKVETDVDAQAEAGR